LLAAILLRCHIRLLRIEPGMTQLEMHAGIVRLTADLLKSLDRSADAVDQVLASAIAATICRGRRLRALGRPDCQERELLAKLLSISGGMRLAPAPTPVEPA
jgi:hypothetical protein